MANYYVASSPYEEDKIVELITLIFDKHTQLCYFQPGDLIYPGRISMTNDSTSAARHPFSSSTRSCFTALNLSTRVISLLERIPHIASRCSYSYPFYHSDSMLTCPEDTENLRLSRDPLGFESERPDKHDMSPILIPSDIALVSLANREGRAVIRDTEASTIRMYANYENQPLFNIPEDPPDPRRNLYEFPDRPAHYRNYKAEPAEFFLRSWLEDINLLRVVPWRADEGVEGARLALQPPIKKLMKVENGMTWWEHELANDELVDQSELERDENDEFEELEIKTVSNFARDFRIIQEVSWLPNDMADNLTCPSTKNSNAS